MTCEHGTGRQILRRTSTDYGRVKRVFGPEQVAAAVETDRQWEQAGKGRKLPRRSVDRGGTVKSKGFVLYLIIPCVYDMLIQTLEARWKDD